MDDDNDKKRKTRNNNINNDGGSNNTDKKWKNKMKRSNTQKHMKNMKNDGHLC